MPKTIINSLLSTYLLLRVIVEHVCEIVHNNLSLDIFNVHGHVIVLELGSAELLDLLES